MDVRKKTQTLYIIWLFPVLQTVHNLLFSILELHPLSLTIPSFVILQLYFILVSAQMWSSQTSPRALYVKLSIIFCFLWSHSVPHFVYWFHGIINTLHYHIHIFKFIFSPSLKYKLHKGKFLPYLYLYFIYLKHEIIT